MSLSEIGQSEGKRRNKLQEFTEPERPRSHLKAVDIGVDIRKPTHCPPECPYQCPVVAVPERMLRLTLCRLFGIR